MRNLELILNKLLKDEKHQTRVSLLLELVSDANLTTKIEPGTSSLPRRLLYLRGIVKCVEDYRSQVRFVVR